jgi:hypothetical protein
LVDLPTGESVSRSVGFARDVNAAERELLRRGEEEDGAHEVHD